MSIRNLYWMHLTWRITLPVLFFFVLAAGLAAWKLGYTPILGRFFAAAPADDIVRVEGSQLVLNGERYIVRGIMPTTFDVTGTWSFFDPIGGVEMFAPNRFWRDFDAAEADIDRTFAYFADELGVNTIRFLTPMAKQWGGEIQYYGLQPWFLSGGAINPYYRDRLIRFISIAYRHGVRIQLSLMADVKAYEWECRDPQEGQQMTWGPWTGCYNTDERFLKLAGLYGSEAVRFLRPGSEQEQFYMNYLDSLIPSLKDNPGVFAYEISNENLWHWPVNGLDGAGASRDNVWYADQVGSFLRRMISRVRQLDPGHLIGSGEVAYYNWQGVWAPLAGELGNLHDIDNLNGGQDYTLASLVDFIGGHLYNFISGDTGASEALVRTVAQRTEKPLVFGEFNFFDRTYDFANADLRYPISVAGRTDFFRMGAKLVDEGIVDGFFVYDPIPPVIGSPEKWLVSDNIPWGGGTRRGVVLGDRKLVGIYPITSWLLDYAADRPYRFGLLPEAQFLVDFWRNIGRSTVSPSPTPVVVPVSCTPSLQYVDPNQNANLVAQGGGPYTWSAPGGIPAAGTGQMFSVYYASAIPNTRIVTVTRGIETAQCTVVIESPPSLTPSPILSPSPTPTPSLSPTLLIDNGVSSTRPQLEMFNLVGRNFSAGGTVSRLVQIPNGNIVTLPTRTADSHGNVSWPFRPDCTSAIGIYTVWAVDHNTERRTNDVTETVTQDPSCSSPGPTPGVRPETYGLREGDTVSATGSNDPDIYIVNVYGFKRLFLNPVIFNFYGHLGGFAKVKTITPSIRDTFATSGLFRNCETNDQRVYAAEIIGEDQGVLHWIDMSGEQAAAQDPDFFKKIFCINNNEYSWYPKSLVNYTSLNQVPVYSR